jgi:hypothetical protein
MKKSKIKSEDVSQAEKLKQIENDAFGMGKVCHKSFHETNNRGSLRDTVASYRLSMQAIRDQSKHKISK